MLFRHKFFFWSFNEQNGKEKKKKKRERIKGRKLYRKAKFQQWIGTGKRRHRQRHRQKIDMWALGNGHRSTLLNILIILLYSLNHAYYGVLLCGCGIKSQTRAANSFECVFCICCGCVGDLLWIRSRIFFAANTRRKKKYPNNIYYRARNTDYLL